MPFLGCLLVLLGVSGPLDPFKKIMKLMTFRHFRFAAASNRTSTHYICNVRLLDVRLAEIWLQSYLDMPGVTPNRTQSNPKVTPKWPQSGPNIYRTSTEDLPNTYRAYIENRSIIYRKQVEHLSNIYRTGVDLMCIWMDLGSILGVSGWIGCAHSFPKIAHNHVLHFLRVYPQYMCVSGFLVYPKR